MKKALLALALSVSFAATCHSGQYDFLELRLSLGDTTKNVMKDAMDYSSQWLHALKGSQLAAIPETNLCTFFVEANLLYLQYGPTGVRKGCYQTMPAVPDALPIAARTDSGFVASVLCHNPAETIVRFNGHETSMPDIVTRVSIEALYLASVAPGEIGNEAKLQDFARTRAGMDLSFLNSIKTGQADKLLRALDNKTMVVISLGGEGLTHGLLAIKENEESLLVMDSYNESIRTLSLKPSFDAGIRAYIRTVHPYAKAADGTVVIKIIQFDFPDPSIPVRRVNNAL